MMEFIAVARPDEDGVLVITVPGLPAAISQADTKEEAIANALEAVEATFIGSLEDGGLPERNDKKAPLRAPRGGL